MERFPLRRAGWALPFVLLFCPRRPEAVLDTESLEVRMGALGRARIPVRDITRISTMRWPWWAGAGVRIGRGMVAFAAASGTGVVIDLGGPLDVRAPLRWSTPRIVVVPEHPERLVAALAAARELAAEADARARDAEEELPGGEAGQPSTG